MKKKTWVIVCSVMSAIALVLLIVLVVKCVKLADSVSDSKNEGEAQNVQDNGTSSNVVNDETETGEDTANSKDDANGGGKESTDTGTEAGSEADGEDGKSADAGTDAENDTDSEEGESTDTGTDAGGDTDGEDGKSADTGTDAENNTDSEEGESTDTGTDAEGDTDRENGDITDSDNTDDKEDTKKVRRITEYTSMDAILSEMTLEEKIYQMFIVKPEQLVRESGVYTVSGNYVTSADDRFDRVLEKYPVGGVVLFAGNLTGEQQTKDMIQNMQASAGNTMGMKLFTCVDEEGGRVARVAGNSAFGVKNVGPMAKIRDKDEAFAAGAEIGKYLHRLGFNVDFAPDADVITNPLNKVIGDRSFGTEADVVTELAIAYSDGLHSENVMSTFKHFPGHGATEGDTHEGYAFTNKSLDELMEAELKPFMEAGKNGVEFCMSAHISIPKILGEETPCSLSKQALTGILREQVGYDGLIITDALEMGAIVNKYGTGKAAAMAVEAGADVLLMPDNLKKAYEGICAEIDAGNITEERIDESVRRILKYKLRLEQ